MLTLQGFLTHAGLCGCGFQKQLARACEIPSLSNIFDKIAYGKYKALPEDLRQSWTNVVAQYPLFLSMNVLRFFPAVSLLKKLHCVGKFMIQLVEEEWEQGHSVDQAQVCSLVFFSVFFFNDC